MYNAMTEEEYKGLKQLRDIVGQAEKGTKDTGEKHRDVEVYEAHHLLRRAWELLDGAVKRIEKEGVST